jgi:hypothetical protein
MTLYSSFRAELLKISRSHAWLLTFLFAAIVPVIMTIVFEADTLDDINKLKGDPWNKYFEQARMPLSVVFLPLFILLCSTLLPQIEHRNNTWKQVLTSPQRLWQIYLSKFLVVQLLILVFLLAYLPLMYLSAWLFGTIYPVFQFADHALNWKLVVMNILETYVSVFAIAAIQFWLGMRFRNFIIPLAIGLVLWFVSCILLMEMHSTTARYFPFSLPILINFSKYQFMLGTLLWCSVAYMVGFTAIGYADFTMRKAKG